MRIAMLIAGLLASSSVASALFFDVRPIAISEARLGHLIYVDRAPIRVEIADTPELRERGLSGRSSIGENEGMLFVFEKPGRYGMWMKDMHMPIDIMWLTERGVVVHTEENVTPETYPHVFFADADASYVLETRAGFAKEHRVGKGSLVVLD